MRVLSLASRQMPVTRRLRWWALANDAQAMANGRDAPRAALPQMDDDASTWIFSCDLADILQRSGRIRTTLAHATAMLPCTRTSSRATQLPPRRPTLAKTPLWPRT